VLDIKTSPLKKSLREVFKGVPGLSLAEETPEVIFCLDSSFSLR
jgi:hypothetical protein